VSRRLVTQPEVVADLTSARDWYEAQRPGLGAKFLDAAAASIEHVADQPEIYALIYRRVRRCKVRKFPYVVYYRTNDDYVEIMAVLHASRHPRTWKSRL
jgi:plasmid stabilization system protein ParE